MSRQTEESTSILYTEDITGFVTTTIQQQDLEVGNSYFPEFDSIKKGAIRKLGSISKGKPRYRPYYLANISRRQRTTSSSNIIFPRIGKKEPKVVVKDTYKVTNKGSPKELLIRLLEIIVIEMLRIGLLGGVFVLQVAVVVISEVGELLKSSAKNWEGIRTKRGQQAGQRSISKRGTRKRKKKSSTSRRKEEKLQDNILEEGYRRQGGMTVFPDPVGTAELVSESSIGGVILQDRLGYSIYNRRFVIPILLSGSAGVLFFKRRDTTEFLERYNELYKGYRVADKQKFAKLL